MDRIWNFVGAGYGVFLSAGLSDGGRACGGERCEGVEGELCRF